ncbi:hypothetical protein B0H63DRAFT_454164 [Podospora didyma]|uniref:Uncharacterized protein n=1 Tax=Podospora didyma TaxID=330526 RepID=A0AAE0K5D2_9PEZI|nr:hypothetical protein B0H63DRAFT_454164 [Podospora didyma]
MAAISIPQVLAKSRAAPPPEVISLENVLRNIDFTKQVTEWANWVSDKCVMCQPSVQWAVGKQDIVRSMDWNVFDMSLVRLPPQPTPPIVPLDTKDFKLKAHELKPKDFVEQRLEEFLGLMDKAELSHDTFASPELLMTVISIDDFTNPGHPVIKPMAIECVAQDPKLNDGDEMPGHPDFQKAGADFYLPALRNDQTLGDDVTLLGMAGCEEDDLYYAAADSFQLTP